MPLFAAPHTPDRYHVHDTSTVFSCLVYCFVPSTILSVPEYIHQPFIPTLKYDVTHRHFNMSKVKWIKSQYYPTEGRWWQAKNKTTTKKKQLLFRKNDRKMKEKVSSKFAHQGIWASVIKTHMFADTHDCPSLKVRDHQEKGSHI